MFERFSTPPILLPDQTGGAAHLVLSPDQHLGQHCSLSPLPILLGPAMQMIPPQIPTARPTGRLGATHLDVPCLPETSWSLLPQCHTRHTQLPSVTNVENWEYTEMWHSVLGSPLYHKTIGTPYTAASPTSVDRPRSTSHTTGPNTSRIHPRNTIYGATFGSQLVGTRTSPPTTAPAKQHSKRPTSQSWPRHDQHQSPALEPKIRHGDSTWADTIGTSAHRKAFGSAGASAITMPCSEPANQRFAPELWADHGDSSQEDLPLPPRESSHHATSQLGSTYYTPYVPLHDRAELLHKSDPPSM